MNKLFDRYTSWVKGWRTWIFNGLSAIIPIMELTPWREILPPDWVPYWGIFVAVGNMYLRWRTNSPLGKKL